MKKVPSMPGSLEKLSRALKNDHAFLLKGDVSPKNWWKTFITTSVRMKPTLFAFAASVRVRALYDI